MTRLSVDDQSSNLILSASQRIGEVLRNVVASLPPNRVVTEIFVDGKQLSKNPEATFLAQIADSVKEVQIKTADKEIWAATGLDIALSCIDRVKRSLIRAAELFRDENKAKANSLFVHCIDGLERFFEAVVISRSVLSLNFDTIMVDGYSLSQIEKDFSGTLQSIMVFQEKQSWCEIADKIEYELLTNLVAWTKGLNQLRLSHMSNA
jgi:hypothetical protein